MSEKIICVETYGLQTWYSDGVIHRSGDLPAKIYADGSVEYYCHGKRHREGGEPAVVYANGTKEWWWNGKRHRANGLPAVECSATSREAFFLHGEQYASDDSFLLLLRSVAAADS